MNIRSFIHAALVLSSLPLAGCSGDDDAPNAGSPLAGHTYVLTTTPGDWAKPKGIATDVENVMPHFLFSVTSTGGNNVNVKMTVAPKLKDENMMVLPDVEQDLCSPTYDIPSSGTASQLGPMDVSLHLIYPGDEGPGDDLQVTATVYDLAFKNIFPANGKAWTQAQIDSETYPGVLDATMDFRQLAPLFAALYNTDNTPPTPPTAQQVCDQLPAEAKCQPCSDGVVTCITAQALYLHAENDPAVTVESVDLASRPATCN